MFNGTHLSIKEMFWDHFEFSSMNSCHDHVMLLNLVINA